MTIYLWNQVKAFFTTLKNPLRRMLKKNLKS